MSATCFSSSGWDAGPAGCPQVFWLVLTSQERSSTFPGGEGFRHIHCWPPPFQPGLGMRDLGAAGGQNTSGKHKWNVFLSKCPPPSQNSRAFKRASQTPPAVYKRSCISLLVMNDGRSENRDLLFLWWIEFGAWIMVTNVIENIAFPLYGFIEHRDDNPLPSDW